MFSVKVLVAGLVTAITTTLFADTAYAEEKRLALLLANQDYPDHVGKLSNTHNDAKTVEDALNSIGFQVTKVLDANKPETETAITNFEVAIEQEAADGDDVVVFVYASMHGATANDGGAPRNFLLPAREDFKTPGNVIRNGIRVDELIRSLSASSAKAVVFVSDACRNELKASYSKSTTKGFVPVSASKGVVVAYATAPGSTTPDDGLFARVLARELKEDGRRASFAILESIEEVAKQRAFDGLPHMASGGLPEWFCFSECPSDLLLSETEAIALGQALSSNSIGKMQEFRDRFPESNFLDLIETRMENVGPRDLQLTIKRIDCLLADDEGPSNAVEINNIYVRLRPPGSDDTAQPISLYEYSGKSKKFSTGDSIDVNKTAIFQFDPTSDGKIHMSAYLEDNDDWPFTPNEIGQFKDRLFPIDRVGQEQSFNLSSQDFSFNIVYQFDEL